ncbi:hypothetical protein D9M71_154080 [compost metagenome]
MAQVVVYAHAVGRGKVGQEVLAQLDLDIAALGNLDGVFQGLGDVGEQLGHFRRGLEVLLIGIVARAARVIQDPAFADAHTGFVSLEVVGLDEAHVVGGHQWRAATIGQGNRRMDVLFVVDPCGALQLQVETVGEHGLPLGQQGFGAGLVTAEQGHADLPFLGAGQGDQAFGRLLHPLALDDHQAVALAF